MRTIAQSYIKEEYEKGIMQGMEKGIMQGMEKGKIEGIEMGKIEGLEKGIEMLKSMLKISVTLMQSKS